MGACRGGDGGRTSCMGSTVGHARHGCGRWQVRVSHHAVLSSLQEYLAYLNGISSGTMPTNRGATPPSAMVNKLPPT